MNMVVGLEKLVCSFIDSIFAKKNSRTSGLLNFNLFNPEMLENVLLSQKYIVYRNWNATSCRLWL